MEGLKIDLTLSNLKTIKLWFFLVEKCKCGLVRDRELSREDHETITKINALAITAREESDHDLRLFGRRRG